MTFSHLLLPALLTALVGCSSTKLAESPSPGPVAGSATAAKPSTPPPVQAAQSSVKTVTLHPLDDPQSPLTKRSIFFEFDSFQISAADGPVIEAHSKYLAANRTAKVRIEGNCDERGGREYNLALGQRRAEAVRKSLLLLGAADAAMEATSFGKEKPIDPGHDEAAWARNRRADIRYLSR